MQIDSDSIKQIGAQLIEQKQEALAEEWVQAVLRTFRGRDAQAIIPEELMRGDAGTYLKLLADTLLERPGEGAADDLVDWITDGTQYFIHIEDIVSALQWIERRIETEVRATAAVDNPDEVIQPIREVIDRHLRCAVERFRQNSEKHHEKVKERGREMMVCWELVKVLQGIENLEDIFTHSVPPLKQVLGFEQYRVLLFDEDESIYETFSDGFMGPAPEIYSSGVSAPVPAFQWCLNRREPYVSSDVSRDPKIANADILIQSEIRSFACNLLVGSQSVVGALVMSSASPRGLTISQTGVLQEICGVMAQAFERTLAEEHASKRQAELEIIGLIGTSLLEVTHQSEVLNAVARALQRFKGFFDVCLFRVDEASRDCLLVAHAGTYAHLLPEGYRQAIGKGLVGLCAQNGEMVLSNDARNDSRRILLFEGGEVVKSELAIPIHSQNKVIGVMHFESEHVNAFDRRDVQALEAIATYIGAALQNAVLTEEHERARYEIERAYHDMEMIMDSAVAGITSIDHEGAFTHWSNSCRKIFGYSAEEAVGRVRIDELAAEPLDLKERLAECRKKGQMTLDRPIRRKDGQIRWIHETRVPVRDEDGTHVGYCAYVVDITEQHESEVALRQERDKLDLVISAMGAGIALLDADGRVQLSNRTLMEWFDFDEGKLGRSCNELFQCDPQVCKTCLVRTVVEQGQSNPKMIIRPTPDGLRHYYQTIFTPLRHGEARVLLLVIDITEQVQHMEQLNLLRKLGNTTQTTLELDKLLHIILTCVTFGHALGFNRAGILLVDEERKTLKGRMAVGPANAGEAYRIWHELSQRTLELEELIDTSPPRADTTLDRLVQRVSIPMNDNEDMLVRALHERRTRIISGPDDLSRLNPQLRDDLNFRNFVCVPLIARDNEVGLIVADNLYTQSPITEEHVSILSTFSAQAGMAVSNAVAHSKLMQSLNELRRTQGMLIEQERLAVVGRMASHVAHEIRNPLVSIGLLSKKIARRHKEDVQTHFKATTICEEVERLEDILRNLMDYTSPKGRRKLHIEDTDVNEIINDTIGQFRQIMINNDIKCKPQFAENLPQAQLDRRQIKQALINLLKNAIEALDRKGGRIDIATCAGEGSIYIQMADNGPGMREETVKKLFTPFFTTKRTGSGLGMAVIKKIVDEHDGQITVDSELGRGTSFNIRLPVAGPKVNERPRESEDEI